MDLTRSKMFLTAKFEDYAVKREMFLEITKKFNVEVELDTFADVYNFQVDNFLTKYENSLESTWHGQKLWVNAPFSLMGDVVLKLVYEMVVAVVIVPVWGQHHWYKAILHLARSTLDFPVGMEFFEIRNSRGTSSVGPLPWGVKACLVDTRLQIGMAMVAPGPGQPAVTKAARRRERRRRTLLAMGRQIGPETEPPALTDHGVDRWLHGVDPLDKEC